MSPTPPSAGKNEPVAQSSAARPARPARRTKQWAAIALVAVAVIVIAVMSLPGGSSTPVTEAAFDNLPVTAAPAPAAAGAAGSTVPTVKSPSKKTPKVAKARIAESKDLPAPPIAMRKPSAEPAKEDAEPAKEDAATKPVEPESRGVSTEALGRTPVTITGCLEMSVDESEFRLTDTEGADAPRARSWKTGFLKKRSAAVALIEPPDPRGLQKQIGKRVAATGLLTSHEMKVNSLQVLGASCN